MAATRSIKGAAEPVKQPGNTPGKSGELRTGRAGTLPSKHEFEKTQVECRSGHKADEYPVAFVFEGARLEAKDSGYQYPDGI